MIDKAVPKSISFRPGSLYLDAERYGKNMPDKLNPSEVVCKALRALFSSEGFIETGSGFNEHASRLAKIDAMLRDHPDLAGEFDAILSVNRRTRRRRAA